MAISGIGIVGVGIAAYAAQPQSPPIARYTMDAGTMSGLAAMGGAGGGMKAAMAMLPGKGGAAAHEMILRLGSTHSATGTPKADHFMPSGAGLGKSVPLISPVPSQPGPASPQGQLPKAKLYIYWGCGEHAPKGQPLVIDFSKLAKGQVPPGLYAQGPNLPEDWQVHASNRTTYGDWPNGKDAKPIPANASLLGEHRVVGTYSPQINFSLDRDYMPPLKTQSTQMASGAYGLNWNAIPEATGYYAWVMSAKGEQPGDTAEMVWWASSATQQFGGPMWDWLSPAAVTRLIESKTVIPPSQTSCTVPAEVRQSGGEVMIGNLYAYGPQSDFSYPPRPADVKVAWKPDWIARVRFRSNATFLLGMPDMGGMGMAGQEGADQDAQAEPQPSAKPKCKGLKGIAMRAAGLCE